MFTEDQINAINEAVAKFSAALSKWTDGVLVAISDSVEIISVYNQTIPVWVVEKNGEHAYCQTQDQVDWYCCRGWLLTSYERKYIGRSELERFQK